MQWGFNRRGGLTPKIALIAVYPEMTPYGALSSQEKWRYINGDWDDDKSLRFDPLIHVQASLTSSIRHRLLDFPPCKSVTGQGLRLRDGL
jgi:hypothetical protein